MSEKDIRMVYNALIEGGEYAPLTGDWERDRESFSSQYEMDELLVDDEFIEDDEYSSDY